MSSIFKASNLDGDTVAVKVFYHAQMSEVEFDRASREIQIMGLLRNQPNVVRLLGDFEEGEATCIVMEFCGKGDLHKYLMRNGPQSEKWACTKVYNVILPLVEPDVSFQCQHCVTKIA